MTYGPAPEAVAPAHAWLDAHDRRFGLFIGGTWSAGDGETFETANPATGRSLARLAQASPDDVDRAVRAARAAQPGWWDLGGHGRARHLYALARHIQKQSRFFAVLESLDNGKPIRESRDIDIPLVARHFYHHAGWAQLMDRELPDRVPVGVVGQIIPWNFPLLMLAWKIAPALAMGNTVVLKPAEFTSLTALRFAELCAEAGLPPGVVNILTGDGRAGEALVAHPGRGQDRLHRLDRSGPAHPRGHGGQRQEALARAGRQVAVPGLRRRRPRQRGRGRGGRDLVQPGAGLLRGLANSGAGGRGRPARRQAEARGWRRSASATRSTRRWTWGPSSHRCSSSGSRDWCGADRRRAPRSGSPRGPVPRDGWFYPPTLFTEVSPAATIAQVEIFGPVVVLMTFRTPVEAVELANNTRYGLAASLWTENINLALDVAPQLQAGTVWINCTNVFDAASGFGGYRESGFGREGGREGLREYVRWAWEEPASRGLAKSTRRGAKKTAATKRGSPSRASGSRRAVQTLPPIDRTPKLYIGGKQVRPDSGYSLPVLDGSGHRIGEVGHANRKDVRNAVEAAHKAAVPWARTTAHGRAQVLYYLAENLAARAEELAARSSEREVELAVERIYTWAAWADKYDGLVHHTPYRNVTLAMPEPIGVIGVVCPDACPLLGLVSTVLPAIALGNVVVAVPSAAAPLAATDFYQVLDTSDVPAGVVNILTGTREELTPVLAAHDDLDGLWYFGDAQGSAEVERLSAGNMKRTWVSYGHGRDWTDTRQGEGDEFLEHATQVKNIWIPYGE